MTKKLDLFSKTRVYSWGVKIDFLINNRGGFFDVDETSFSLLWNHDLIVTIEPRKIHPNLSDAGSKGFRLIVNATDTAGEAERIGTRIAYSLLDFCIHRRWGIELSWPDSPLPCRVTDRNASTGISFQAFGSTTSHVKVSEFVTALEASFSHHDIIPYSLLLSMELYGASHFENNQRSKLIMIMSSLEALAGQRDMTSQLGSLISDLKKVIAQSDIEDDRLINSLKGQIDGLKRESIRGAIKRLLSESEISEDDKKFVDEAYMARSKIVHEGQRIPELSTMNSKLEKILISVYKCISNQ